MSVPAIAEDIAEHPWVLVGFAALLLLVPLAVTSTKGWVRRLGGKRWQQLHRLIYPAAVLGVLHYLWLVKKDIQAPVTYGIVLSAIFLARLVIRRRPRRPDAVPLSSRATPT
jgi:sulfoxide reductase heme-binding subunit YedZ